MSTKMDGIYQRSLFEKNVMMEVFVGENSRYKVLNQSLPWVEMASVANTYRSKKINIFLGREMNLRLHLGAYVAQSMNGWTDRLTEEMVRYHAGVKILCGLEMSVETIDRTSIESFRNQIGKDGASALNQIIVRHAAGAGFTGSELCSSDTTVQEAPIAYPTEVGHMKNIAEKLKGIGTKIGKKFSDGIKNITDSIHKAYTDIRLGARGKTEKAIELKKKLSQQMHKNVSELLKKVKTALPAKSDLKKTYNEKLELFQKMQEQIKVWLATGFHPKNKILSLWHTDARAISKEKSGKDTEFGQRWIINRLLGGYVTGMPCFDLGGGNDLKIADEVIIHHLDTFGELPEAFVYDRGGDGPQNQIFLENLGITHNCIFKNGGQKMNVPDSVFEMARSERPSTEASIAALKSQKYNFTKPRAKTMDSCVLKGHTSMLGFNVTNLTKDIFQTCGMKLEIT